MQTSNPSSRRWIYLITTFIFGSSSIVGSASTMKQDAWIALLISMVYVLPITLIYARIISLYPNKNIYEVVFLLFGKVAGYIISILFIWYSLHLGALVINNYATFLITVQIPESPRLGLMIVMIPAVVYIAKKGPRCLARWSSITLFMTIVVLLSTSLVSLKSIQLDNLLPVMEHSLSELMFSAFEVFSFPFAEMVLFLAVVPKISGKDKPKKILVVAVCLSFLMFLIQLIRNITVGGAENLAFQLYPSYFVVKIIKLSESLSRFESLISLTLVLCGIAKITVCLLAVSKGLTKLIKVDSYKSLVAPSGMLLLLVSSLLYRNSQQQFGFLYIYTFYAIPFQIVLPIIIWITAEIKNRTSKKRPKIKHNH